MLLFPEKKWQCLLDSVQIQCQEMSTNPDWKHKTRWKHCMKTFSLSNMGQKAVKSHADWKKHQTVAGKLHSAESVLCFSKKSQTKKEKSVKLGVWGNLLPHSGIKLLWTWMNHNQTDINNSKPLGQTTLKRNQSATSGKVLTELSIVEGTTQGRNFVGIEVCEV